MQIVAGKYRIGREQKNNLYKIIGSNKIRRIANIRMERSGFNSDPVFSDQDEHSDNVSVRSSSKLLPPPSWNESSVYSKELPAGATLEHYKFLKVLGSGGFGITYLVRDTMLKRKVVLKENFPSSYAYRDPFTGRVIPNNEHDAESFQ